MMANWMQIAIPRTMWPHNTLLVNLLTTSVKHDIWLDDPVYDLVLILAWDQNSRKKST